MRTKTDEQLVERLKAGRPEALDELYRRYAGKLTVFCARSMAARHPEDLVHDVFARVIEASDRFDAGKASFRTWIYRIARNRCIDQARRERKVGFVSLDRRAGAGGGATGASLGETIPADGGDAEDSAIANSVAEAVRSCLGALPRDAERQAVVLYYLSEKVYREIGAILGMSTSMAQKRVKNAKEKLRRCLKRKGVAA